MQNLIAVSDTMAQGNHCSAFLCSTCVIQNSDGI